MRGEKFPSQFERPKITILLDGRPFRLIGMPMPLRTVTMGWDGSRSFAEALCLSVIATLTGTGTRAVAHRQMD